MNTFGIRIWGILGLLLTSSVTAQANDIVDFLRAMNGVPEHRGHEPMVHQVGHHEHGGQSIHRGHGMHGAGYGDRNLSSRDIYKRNSQVADRDMHYLGHSQNQGHSNRGGFDPQRVDLRHGNFGHDNFGHSELGRSGYGRQSHPQRTGSHFSFRVSSNSGAGYGQPLYIPTQEPVQVLPPVHELPPAQVYPSVPNYPVAPAFPHQVGEIVDCHVPLATCVRVEDECNIAPNAVPIVVAVRDPNTCGHQCEERIMFVQVCVPPCPPRSIRVTPCHSRVTMDFGQYEVDIKSRDGLIVVDYDN